MHKKKRDAGTVTPARRSAADDDYVIDRERRNDHLLTWILILTLVLGIAAMSVDYVWKTVPHEAESAWRTESSR